MQEHNDLSICDVCTPGERNVTFFKLNDTFYKMVSKIPEIKSSRIFNKLWKECGETLKDEVVTTEMLLKTWSNICEKLEAKNQEFLDGEMQLKKINKFVKMFGMDYTALKKEFMLLSRFFNGATTHLDQVQKKLDHVITKVKSYRKLFDAQQAAQAILELREALDLQGDFSEVEKVKEVRVYIM